ncbi:TolC family protein [Burkholderia gladioli]|uniref:TolC family protein n=1 Tax=Burkholderia gladioli TaxID=28095 RepID=UPI003F7A7687
MSAKNLARFCLIQSLVLVFFSATASKVYAFDPLRAEQSISANAGGSLVEAMGSTCDFDRVKRNITLQDAIERGLCRNPKTREAWADVKARAAAVGLARSAYLPNVSGNWLGTRDSSVVRVVGRPEFDTDTAATVQSSTVSLNWLIFDFGGREAALSNATAMLAAAKATQDATLQVVFATIAKDYFAAQEAEGALAAASAIEEMMRQSVKAVQTRVDHGVAPISDLLQAQTQYEEAVLGKIKATGDTQIALGTLASDMDDDPSVNLLIRPVTEGVPPGRVFYDTVNVLIEEAKATHPSVRAAQAQLDASVAKVSQTRAEGRPSISLVAKYTRNNQPQSIGLGLPSYPANGHDAYVGVQINIPFFEGFGRGYRIDQAQAEVEHEEAEVNAAKQQVALDVWNAYHGLETATQAATNSISLMKIAERSFTVARQRYELGVGGILELLGTQTTLANARLRHVRALTAWYNARVDLASKLGRLDFQDLSANL